MMSRPLAVGLAVSIAASIAVSIAASACTRATAWDGANRDALQRDVGGLLRGHGLTAALDCHMIGSTRNAYCTFKAPAAQVALVASALKLKERGVVLDTLLAVDVAAAPGGCRAAPAFAEPSRVRVLGSERRPPQLALANGAAFEFLVLYRREDSDDVCVQVSYAYG